MKQAEFDRHAARYDGGLDNPLKRMMGNAPDQFIAVKARWLLRHEPALKSGKLALLDYGCGAGDLMRVLAGLGARAEFTGCDVSSGMLAEVAQRWPAIHGAPPAIAPQDGARTPFADGSFDIATISAVLHGAARYEFDTDYLMFMPPGLAFLRPLDRALAWLPLGAQYVVAARKPVD